MFSSSCASFNHTILNQDVQTLLDQQRRVEDDKAETQRKNIIGGSLLEELTDSNLDEEGSEFRLRVARHLGWSE